MTEVWKLLDGRDDVRVSTDGCLKGKRKTVKGYTFKYAERRVKNG